MITVTDEEAQGISDRLVEILWKHGHVRRDDPAGEHELIVADASALTERLLQFTIEEAGKFAFDRQLSEGADE